MDTTQVQANAQDVDTRAAWDAIAPDFDRTNTPTQMAVAMEGLRRAGVRAGMRFLDVAAGSGALSIPAARLGADVLATDRSPAMLELLRDRARSEGLSALPKRPSLRARSSLGSAMRAVTVRESGSMRGPR